MMRAAWTELEEVLKKTKQATNFILTHSSKIKIDKPLCWEKNKKSKDEKIESICSSS